METALKTHEPFSVFYRVLKPGGEVRLVHARGAVVTDEQGNVIRVHGAAQDVTERKRAEEVLQTFSKRLIEAQEAERRRVARELHDEIGQTLTAIKINLQTVGQSAETLSLAPRLKESVAIIDRALEQVRDLSLDLRPSLLDDLGLVAALRWYVDRESRRAGLVPELVADLSATPLPPELETACFRITQEALTNVVRHSQARRVWVTVRQRGEELQLVIRDDGLGFDVSDVRGRRASAESIGLQGMQERALILGGRIEITSTHSQGTEIRATFPLKSGAPQ
jgi:signal transduction histidine kinase